MIFTSPAHIVGAFLAAISVVSGQQQLPNAASTNSNTPSIGGFTPIRLIQPQTQEQQQAIQNLVDELRKSSPQLFSNIGQGNGQQQIAIAIPSTTPNAGAALSTSPSAAQPQQQRPQLQPQPQQPQQQRQPQPQPQQQQQQQPQASPTPQVPQAPASAALPATSSAPAGFTANTPAPAEAEQTASNSDISTPVSFAVNAMFMSPDAENEATDEVGEDQTIPFGLRFDSTSTGQEEADSKSRSTHHSHSSDDESDFDFFDDLSDLDSKATVRAAASLAAIGLSLLASIVLSS